MPERTSWVSVGLAVAICVGVVAGVRLGGFPSVGGDPAVPSLVAPPVVPAEAASLAPRIERMEADLKRLRRELASLRRDHEALSGWTLQSLLSAQGGGGTIAPPAAAVDDLREEVPRSEGQDDSVAGDGRFDEVVDRLELFPQQVAAVEPLVIEYVSLCEAGASSDPASARFAAELRVRLGALLTDEQVRRLDEIVSGSSSSSAASTAPARQ